ncbi:MAG: hypothetical protein HPY75_11700 [Actinobacteria bacterium]|nr:hypothetical protein [Actinomycetota bacterium]
MYRHNLLRMLGGLWWTSIAAMSALLLLPHLVAIRYEMALLVLFAMLALSLLASLLPYREIPPGRRLGLLVGFFGLVMTFLACAAIHYSGGKESPLFPFLLLLTAFTSGLFPSLGSAALLSGISATAYLVTVLLLSPVRSADAQSITAQVFFLVLTSFLVNRLGAESRRQALERERAMEELRTLSQMDKAASSFVSAVSFEMRTPLTSILGFSEMLVSRRLEPEKEREYVEIIAREAQNLSRLIEDLLDISRLESGKLQLQKEVVGLQRLLDMSLPALEAPGGPMKISANIPGDLSPVMVDAQRMKRVFDSLFAYIRKKSGPGSELRLSAKSEGGEVVLTVNIRNRENGGRQHDGARIFPPLGGVEEGDLDLAIAKRIVQAHQGSLSLIPTSGAWFTIVMRLPELTVGDFLAASPPIAAVLDQGTKRGEGP